MKFSWVIALLILGCSSSKIEEGSYEIKSKLFFKNGEKNIIYYIDGTLEHKIRCVIVVPEEKNSDIQIVFDSRKKCFFLNNKNNTISLETEYIYIMTQDDTLKITGKIETDESLDLILEKMRQNNEGLGRANGGATNH